MAEISEAMVELTLNQLQRTRDADDKFVIQLWCAYHDITTSSITSMAVQLVERHGNRAVKFLEMAREWYSDSVVFNKSQLHLAMVNAFGAKTDVNRAGKPPLDWPAK